MTDDGLESPAAFQLSIGTNTPLSIVVDDARRINSWEVRLLTGSGARVEPAAVVVLERMAYLNGRTLVANSVETDANLADVLSAGDAPKLLFVHRLEGPTAGLKWQVRNGEPRALQLQPPK